MKLKFMAVEGRLAADPRDESPHGAIPRFLGRTFDHERKHLSFEERFPIDAEPFEIDFHPHGYHCIAIAKEGCLVPADETTAQRCGLKLADSLKATQAGPSTQRESIAPASEVAQ